MVGKKDVQINMVSKREPFALFVGIGDEEIPDREGVSRQGAASRFA